MRLIMQGINLQGGLTEQPVQVRDLTFLSLHRLIESVSLSTRTLDTEPGVVPTQKQGAKPVLTHSAEA
jgi:hypothetical protein